MATQQDEGGIPFAIAHHLQHFRLLELPPELVELIEAPNPPLYAFQSPPPRARPCPCASAPKLIENRLCIKSQSPAASSTSATPTSNSKSNPQPAYAVLCTPSASYQLRQVQTSNSLFVTQPALETRASQIPSPETRAIASCTATLELHPANGSAVPLLEELLPIYDIIGGEVDVVGNRKSKIVLFSDVPFSDGQCEKAWAELMAFELAGNSYRPSSNTLLQVWNSINAAALAEAIKLDSQFLTDDITKLVGEEGYATSLSAAILRRLANQDLDTEQKWSCLDRRKTVAFVGRTLLEAKQADADYLTADFLDTWKDSLPEAWRSEAELKTIDGAYSLPSSNTICAKSKTVSTSGPSTAPSKAAASKGKWHERFGKTRKK